MVFVSCGTPSQTSRADDLQRDSTNHDLDGEYDEIIRRDHTERLADAIPSTRLVIQPAASHFAMLQNPDQFNKAVIEFQSVGT